MIVVGFQKLSNYKLVALKNLVKSFMNSLFLILNSMVQNYIQPRLADINFCDGIIFNDLPNQIIGSVESSFEGLILHF
jgi:hypothetical protein